MIRSLLLDIATSKDLTHLWIFLGILAAGIIIAVILGIISGTKENRIYDRIYTFERLTLLNNTLHSYLQEHDISLDTRDLEELCKYFGVEYILTHNRQIVSIYDVKLVEENGTYKMYVFDNLSWNTTRYLIMFELAKLIYGCDLNTKASWQTMSFGPSKDIQCELSFIHHCMLLPIEEFAEHISSVNIYDKRAMEKFIINMQQIYGVSEDVVRLQANAYWTLYKQKRQNEASNNS